jgi:membrane-associated phospholipid phosphatase
MFHIPFLFFTRKIKAFLRQPYMQQLRSRYPRVYGFIRNRFHPDEFRGLPLTILVILISVNLFILSELAEHTVNSQGVKNLDMEISAMFFNLRTPLLSLMVYYFTLFGTVYGVAGTTTVVGAVLLWKRRGFYLLALLVAVLGSGLAMQLTKLYFQRERPLNFAYYVPDATYSFPSGHATSAMALMGILGYFIWLEFKDKRVRWALWVLGALYVLSMGFSRIYLGVHFLTDVAAGFLLGLLWVILAIGLMEYFVLQKLRKKRLPAGQPGEPSPPEPPDRRMEA